MELWFQAPGSGFQSGLLNQEKIEHTKMTQIKHSKIEKTQNKSQNIKIKKDHKKTKSKKKSQNHKI